MGIFRRPTNLASVTLASYTATDSAARDAEAAFELQRRLAYLAPITREADRRAQSLARLEHGLMLARNLPK